MRATDASTRMFHCFKCGDDLEMVQPVSIGEATAVVCGCGGALHLEGAEHEGQFVLKVWAWVPADPHSKGPAG